MEKIGTRGNKKPLKINALRISTRYDLWKTSGKGMERQGIAIIIKLLIIIILIIAG